MTDVRQFLTRPWGKVAVAMLATVAAVAVGYVVASEARANHVQSVLTVVKSPTEGGTVTGEGIDCGTDCTESFEHTVICEYDLGFENCWDHFGGSLLRAAPAPGYAFAGWTDCPHEQYGECHASLSGRRLVSYRSLPTGRVLGRIRQRLRSASRFGGFRVRVELR